MALSRISLVARARTILVAPQTWGLLVLMGNVACKLGNV